MTKKERYGKIIGWFTENMPVAETELHYGNPFQLLVAVILSAQCTDRRVNLVTPPLYEAFPTPERLAAAKARRLTPREVSVLASIVDGESKYVPEQPSIAAVYLNRLSTGMRLQADPTVAFCFDYKLNRILKSHLLVDSPYNTYQHAGLPPGPISCPPKTCLEAVLHPSSHNYLYFCADPAFNGTHRFAASYSEHLSNARAFQTALTERQRGKK